MRSCIYNLEDNTYEFIKGGQSNTYCSGYSLDNCQLMSDYLPVYAPYYTKNKDLLNVSETINTSTTHSIFIITRTPDGIDPD